MLKYLTAGLVIATLTGPALAIDASAGKGVGGLGAGGLGVGAGVSAGSQGGSVGVGAGVGGGATVGGSVGAGKAAVGAEVDVGANPPAAVQAISPSTVDQGAQIGTGTADAATGSARNFDLPTTLKPSASDSGGFRRIADGYPYGPIASMQTVPGTPPEIVSACRAAILAAAATLGAVHVYAASAGALSQDGGALTAPIQVRVDYARQGGIQTRKAQVSCHLDAAGSVVAVT